MKWYRIAFSEEFTRKINMAVEYLSDYYNLLDENEQGAEELALLINFLEEALDKDGADL